MTRDTASAPNTTAPSRVALAVRVLLALLAASAAAAALAVGRTGDGDSTAAAGAHSFYVCPMHAEVTAPRPGACPICGMALQPAPDEARPKDRSAEAQNLTRQSLGIARRFARPGDIVAPARVEDDGRVVALLYRDEVASLAPDERAAFVAADRAGVEHGVGRIAATADPEPWDDAVVQVAFRFETKARAPAPGSTGWMKFSRKLRDTLIVPSTAVLQSSEGPYVLVYAADAGGLSRRKVTIGRTFQGMTTIVSGLRVHEPVVVANTLFFAGEAGR
jgi:multidrug efflux pump subunit AcrA (membrane-fusion protein)